MKGQRVTALHALLALTTPVIGLTIPFTRNTPSLDPRNAQSDGATFVYDPIRITKGYVAFGDSYAAGIGTGMTDTGGCRQGQFSYPKQLAKMATDAVGKEIDFQNYPCSGAVVSEVLEGGAKSQIDQWKNPKNADIATISIGGNDVGFYNVLTACVLRVGQAWAGDCDEAVKKAADIINGRDLSNDVNSALNQILAKSGRDDFKIYLTGYPTFFNDQTDYCDYTTFYQWQPGHHDIHRGPEKVQDWAYLYKARRNKLNNLVTSLNSMLQSVANGINRRFSDQKVWFIDPNPAYDGHRFCEQDAKEPDPARDDTWLFLSAWPDSALPDDPSARISAAIQDVAFRSQPSKVTLPDDATCNSSHDWSDLMLCELQKAKLVSKGSAGEVSLDDEIKTDDISWYIPTRSAKTFHPRSLGQKAYVDLIKATWR